MMEKLKAHLLRFGGHYAAILIFYALAALLFSKSFDGYVVRQGDIANWMGMSKEIQDARILLDKTPDWTNSMFGGMPSTQISYERPALDVSFVVSNLVHTICGYNGITSFLMAMLGAYLLAISLGASPVIALLCGVGFGLSTFEILYFTAGHNSKVNAVAYMPFIVAGVMWAYRRNLWVGAAIAALGTAMHVASGHPQMTYYLLMLLAGLGLVEVWRIGVNEANWTKAWMISGVLLVAGIVGVLPRYSHLAQTKDYAAQTIRGQRILSEPDGSGASEAAGGLDKAYILEYSLADGEWWSIMCPDIKGGNSPMYWGEQTFSGGAFYFGAILVALFFMFLVAGRDRLKWPLLALTALSIYLSRRSGSALLDFFLDYAPAFNKFRDTKMMMVLVLLTVSMGAALGLKEMVQSVQAKGGMDSKQRLWWMGSLGVLIALFCGFSFAPELFFDFQSTIRPDIAVEQLGYAEALSRRLEIFRSDVMRTIGLLVVAAGAIGAMLWNKVRPGWVVGILVAVTAVDLWQVDHRYFNEDKVNGMMRYWVKKVDHAFPFAPNPQMMKVLEMEFAKSPENLQRADLLYEAYLDRLGDVRLTRNEQDRLRLVSQFGAMRFASPYRILQWENPFSDPATSYFFQNVGGYHAAKLRRYQDFIERVLMPERERLVQSFSSGAGQAAFAQLPGLQMLNTRYILVEQFPNPIPLPNVPGFGWVATGIQTAVDDDDEMAQTALLSRATDAVVHQAFQGAIGEASATATGQVDLVTYAADYLEYEVELDADGLVVFSEIWYPEGWRATLDGEPVETLRANYVLRALAVPAGRHAVTFSFELPGSPELDVLFNVLLLLFILGASWWGLKSNHGKTERA